MRSRIVAAIKHLVLLALCVWSFYIQLTYRVPGRVIVVLLPWVGVVLVALALLTFISYLLWRTGEPQMHTSLRRLQDIGEYLALGFCLYGVVLFANGALDRSPTRSHRSEIL